MFKRKSKDAEVEVPEPEETETGGGIGKFVLLALVAVIAAVALSPQLRNKALDKLFGAEEEFQYTPPADATTENGSAAGAA